MACIPDNEYNSIQKLEQKFRKSFINKIDRPSNDDNQLKHQINKIVKYEHQINKRTSLE